MKALRRATTAPPRYSAFGLLHDGLVQNRWPCLCRRLDLSASYNVAIIGVGVHGLATAYHVADRHGISKVAVVDKGYLGGGGSGRNTAILRSNYLTEGAVLHQLRTDITCRGKTPRRIHRTPAISTRPQSDDALRPLAPAYRAAL